MGGIKKLVSPLILILLGLLWWFVLVKYLMKPETYRVDIAYGACVIFSLIFHVKALWQYHKMVRFAKELNDPVSLIYAYNQRVRYIIRIFESSLAIGVVVLGSITVKHPAFALNETYQKVVLTYFFGTVVFTGYLTIRDLLVIRHIKRKQGKDPTAMTFAV